MRDAEDNGQDDCKGGAELCRFLVDDCYRRMVRITDDQVGVIRRLARRVRHGERPASAAAVQARRDLHTFFTATQQARRNYQEVFDAEPLTTTPTLPTVPDVLDSLGLSNDEKVERCARDWLNALMRDFPPPRPSHIDGKRVVYGFVSSGDGRGSTYEAGRYCIYWCGHRWWIHDAEEGTIWVRCWTCMLADDDLEPGPVDLLDDGNAYLVPVRDNEAWSLAYTASTQRLNRWAEDLPDDRFPAGSFLAWKLKQEQVAARGPAAPEAGAPTISGTSAWPPTV